MKDASAPGATTSPPTRRMAFGINPNGRRSWALTARLLGVALISFTLLVGAAFPAAAAELMRVTFVRHGESAGNASGLIDTSTPGPVLTQLGRPPVPHQTASLRQLPDDLLQWFRGRPDIAEEWV